MPSSAPGWCPAQPRVCAQLSPRIGAQLSTGLVPSPAPGWCPALGWHWEAAAGALWPYRTKGQVSRCLPAATSAVPPTKRMQASSAVSLADAMVPLAPAPQAEALRARLEPPYARQTRKGRGSARAAGQEWQHTARLGTEPSCPTALQLPPTAPSQSYRVSAPAVQPALR